MADNLTPATRTEKLLNNPRSLTPVTRLEKFIQRSGGGGSGGMSNAVKQALLDCFNHVAWDDEDPTGQSYIDALEDAMYPPEPQKEVVSIDAVYTQTGTVYDTDSLDSLKSNLVVTATYDDETTGVVTGYTLSGTLTAGTSTITVTYEGKTDTFTVTVTETGMLHPLYEGTFDVNVGNGTKIGTATITKGTSNTPSHVEITLTNNAAGGQTSWINFTSGASGTTTAVNDQQTWFTMEAGETYTFTVSNTVNASSLQYSVNLRGATTNTTIDGTSAGNSDAVLTVTPAADVNVGCMIMWLASATFSGKSIEFDATLTDGQGRRYF